MMISLGIDIEAYFIKYACYYKKASSYYVCNFSSDRNVFQQSNNVFLSHRHMHTFIDQWPSGKGAVLTIQNFLGGSSSIKWALETTRDFEG